ncbi:MAG: tRNA (adenine-N1)-methyltransferase [Candidatus Bathyarchaeia archaeon]
MTEIIQEGDNVLLFLDKKRSYLVKIEKEKNFHTHKGFLALDELIGKEYGTQIKSSLNIEFFAFKPTIQDYIFKASRKTQILYPKDIALIILFGNIHAGSRVVEAGTGAGALTMALAYYVKPLGRVYSYEVREEFIEIAAKNLEKSGLSDYAEIKNKDITQGIDEKDVDAVVLDMATPWLAVPHAYQALKGSGILISFSPTIDQVIKTVESLKDNHFASVETIECLVRRMQTERGKTRPETLMTGHTGYITFAKKASC